MTPVGVLVMAYGAAASLDELPAYLADIRRGRPPGEALLREVRERYERIGGRSPLADITQAQAGSLAARLGRGWRVAAGMRHSAPRIAEALRGLVEAGCETVVGLPLTPYASTLSTGAYLAALEEAAAAGRGRPVRVLRAALAHDHPKLIEALADRTAAARWLFGAERPELLFTAHSLPARVEEAGEPYARQLRETAAAVARRLGFERWRLAWQSRGRTPEPWLGPDAAEALEGMARAGARAVLLSPIGFVSEHLETLFDVDVLCREQARRLGLRFERAAALGGHPSFIEALADAVRRSLSTRKGTSGGLIRTRK